MRIYKATYKDRDGRRRKKQVIFIDNHRQKNSQDALKTAILADAQIAPRGFEPLLPG